MKVIKNNLKFIIGVFIGIVLSGISTYALTVAAGVITYDNTQSQLSSTNVQGAIDELYTKADNIECARGYIKGETTSSGGYVCKPPSPWTLPTGKTATTLSVGDEICLKDDSTQCFNFIKYNGTNNEDVVMLAKYNLKVGNIYTGSGEKTGEYASTDTRYGLQSSDTRGYVSDASSCNGTVTFSQKNYWNGNVSSYPADVYDATNYKGAPGTQTYSIAYYVEEYKSKLETNYNATIKSARLLTYAEATDSSIGCSASNYSCPTGFITNTSFWLGSAGSFSSVWIVSPDGNFNLYYSFDNRLGVRPVVVISKSDI